MTVIPRRNWKQWQCMIFLLRWGGGGGGGGVGGWGKVGDNVHYGLCENSEYRFALSLKIGFVTLEPLRDSEKLCILLKGCVQWTCVSDMKIVHKIRRDRIENVFWALFQYIKGLLLQGAKPGPSNSNKWLKSENNVTWSKKATEIVSLLCALYALKHDKTLFLAV